MVASLLNGLWILSFLCGFYRSFKALRSKHLGSIRDSVTFWIIWTLYCTIERPLRLFLLWLPFSSYVELAWWCILILRPQWVITTVYWRGIAPIFHQHEESIDWALMNSSRLCLTFAWGALSSYATSSFHNLIHLSHQVFVGPRSSKGREFSTISGASISSADSKTGIALGYGSQAPMEILGDTATDNPDISTIFNSKYPYSKHDNGSTPEPVEVTPLHSQGITLEPPPRVPGNKPLKNREVSPTYNPRKYQRRHRPPLQPKVRNISKLNASKQTLDGKVFTRESTNCYHPCEGAVSTRKWTHNTTNDENAYGVLEWWDDSKSVTMNMRHESDEVSTEMPTSMLKNTSPKPISVQPNVDRRTCQTSTLPTTLSNCTPEKVPGPTINPLLGKGHRSSPLNITDHRKQGGESGDRTVERIVEGYSYHASPGPNVYEPPADHSKHPNKHVLRSGVSPIVSSSAEGKLSSTSRVTPKRKTMAPVNLVRIKGIREQERLAVRTEPFRRSSRLASKYINYQE